MFCQFIFILLALPIFVLAQNDELVPLEVRSDLEKSNLPRVEVLGGKAKRDQSQIKQFQSRSLGDALKNEPGLDFTGGGRAGTELPQIRGLGVQRILVLEEGVRQNFQGAHAGRGLSDFSLMQNIEVVKGPWSSLYGSGAMGGVVNFRRSTANDLQTRTGQSSGTELALDGSSGSDLLGGRITFFSAETFMQPVISYRTSKNIDLRYGNGERLPYSAARTNDYYSSFSFAPSEQHTLNIKLNHFTQISDSLVNPTLDFSALNPAATLKSVKQDFVVDYLIKKQNYEMRFKPFFRKTTVDKERNSDKRLDIQNVETTGFDTWSNISSQLSEHTLLVSTLGIEAFQDINTGTRNGSKLNSFPNGKSTVYGAYFQPSFIFENKLTFAPGLRYDSYRNQDTNGVAADSKGAETSAKLYTSLEFAPAQIAFAGWGQSYNVPRLQDLYVSDLHFPGNFFVSNPDLKPEHANTYEIGIKNTLDLKENTKLLSSATVYQTDAKDFIQQNVGATTTTFTNVDSVRLIGFEISTSYQKIKWKTGLSYSQVRSRNLISDEPLADTAPDQWSFNYERIIGDSLKLGTDAKYALKQSRIPASTVASPTSDTSEYFVQDFYMTYLFEKFELQARVNNVYDRYYRKHGSNIFEVGRDLRLTVSSIF
jgi:hemoglobin/transferrin/lactoferrin receptor protein